MEADMIGTIGSVVLDDRTERDDGATFEGSIGWEVSNNSDDS